MSSPANAVTSINAPAGIESTKIVKEMRSRFGVILTDGQGSMQGHIFRVAHLGYYDFLDLLANSGGPGNRSSSKVGHKVEARQRRALCARTYICDIHPKSKNDLHFSVALCVLCGESLCLA